MIAENILRQLAADGITVRISADDENLIVPANRLTPAQRSLVLAHKGELLAYLFDARRTAGWLIEAGMRASDFHGDSERARDQMRRECLDTPTHQRADLLAHFISTY